MNGKIRQSIGNAIGQLFGWNDKFEFSFDMDRTMSKLTLQIKTSECGNIITVHDSTLNDTWYYKDLNFEGGKIYV